MLSHLKSNNFLTAVVSSAVTAAVIYFGVFYERKRRVGRLKRELERELVEEPVHDEALVREQLARNYAFLGEEVSIYYIMQGVNALRGSFVIVVGLGGVGSHAAHMLLRAGVGRLRLIDFDQVTLSSLNRHAVATVSDVGMSKAHCLEKHFRKIAPFVKIEVVNELFSAKSAERQLSGNPDFVLDCIDNLETKVDLIKFCKFSNLPVISSMGAGAKADPSRVCIADLSDTQEDPLARAVRRSLKKIGIQKGISVVYSIEKPGIGLLPLEESKVHEADEYAPLANFRSRILPVLGPIPAMFGNAMADFVITKLAKYPMEPLANKLRGNTYMRIHRDLATKEKDRGFELKIKVHEVGYVLEEIWRGRSALSGDLDKLTLARWDPSKPITIENAICLTKKEAEKHEKLSVDQFESEYSAEFLNYVRQRFALERRFSEYRD